MQRHLYRLAAVGLFLLAALGSSIGAPDAETPKSGPSAVGTKGMVVSVSQPASEVGVAVLQKGGNAVDAAVATAFALAVTWPEAGNIGGGGFMLVYPGGKGNVMFFDYRETAPAAATKEMFAGDKRPANHLRAGRIGKIAHADRLRRHRWAVSTGETPDLARTR